jgi:hypothetical protein
MVWMDAHTHCGTGMNMVPVLIHLKDSSQFPHQEQYPLRPGVKEEQIPIIKDLNKQGLLIECSNSYYTPILGVQKGPKKWRLVQIPT